MALILNATAEGSTADAERGFHGDKVTSRRQLFAWLTEREGIRDDRSRSVAPDGFVLSDRGDGVSVPLAVRLPLRRASRDVSMLCTTHSVAAHHLCGFLGIKWGTLQAVAERSPLALCQLVADAWGEKVGVGLLRWRVVDSTVRAIVTSSFRANTTSSFVPNTGGAY
jgi:hypothetical protein